MRIKKYAFRIAVALVAFALGFGAYAEFQFMKALFVAQRQQETLSPPPTLPVEAVLIAEAAGAQMGTTDQSEVVAPILEEEPAPEFDAGGYYYLAGEKPPKGFENFENLEIITMDYDIEIEPGVYGKPTPPKGSVFTTRDYKFIFLTIGTKHMAFETEKINGISYKFTGEFTSSDSCDLDGETVALRGHLIKIKDGKKIAETDTEFYASCGC